MTKIIGYDTETAAITDFRRSPKGKKERVIKARDHKHDPRRLRREAEKEK